MDTLSLHESAPGQRPPSKQYPFERTTAAGGRATIHPFERRKSFDAPIVVELPELPEAPAESQIYERSEPVEAYSVPEAEATDTHEAEAVHEHALVDENDFAQDVYEPEAPAPEAEPVAEAAVEEYTAEAETTAWEVQDDHEELPPVDETLAPEPPSFEPVDEYIAADPAEAGEEPYTPAAASYESTAATGWYEAVTEVEVDEAVAEVEAPAPLAEVETIEPVSEVETIEPAFEVEAPIPPAEVERIEPVAAAPASEIEEEPVAEVEHVVATEPVAYQFDAQPVVADGWVQETVPLEQLEFAERRVIVRLLNGEPLEVAAAETATEAVEAARQVVQRIGEAEAAGEWPELSGRYIRPDTIVSVDIQVVG